MLMSRIPLRAHIQGAGDGSRRQREDVHLGAQLLEMLLMLHAKSLFLVDNHQTQIPNLNICR